MNEEPINWHARATKAEADRDAWKARAEKAEAHIAECNQTVIWHTCCPEDARRLSQMRESDERAEMAESRATQAEAQAAAMRAVLQRLEAETVNEDGMTFRRLHFIALGGLDTDAGRTLLAEVEALRAVEVAVRDWQTSNGERSMQDYSDLWTEVEEKLAAVDAARKGGGA